MDYGLRAKPTSASSLIHNPSSIIHRRYFSIIHHPSSIIEPMASDKKSLKTQWGGRSNHSSSIVRSSSRRGPLTPLMTDEQKTSANIQALSYDFACRIIRLFQYLTEDSEYKEHIISKQVYRSGTSIGANTREAQRAQSTADFVSKMSIAQKESDETDYWLHLLHDNGYITDSQFISINNDCQRILRLLSSIIKKAKSNQSAK